MGFRYATGRLYKKRVSGGIPTATFTTKWKTDNTGVSNDDQITLGLVSGGTYDFDVYWGDGNSDHITAWDDAKKLHTYSSIGTYQVVIDGMCRGWRMYTGGDPEKLVEILQWGNAGFNFGNGGEYFYNCYNLKVTAEDIPDLTGVTSFYRAFRGTGGGLTDVPNINSWFTSNITQCDQMFHDARKFNGDVSNFDTSNIVRLDYMFYYTNLLNCSFANWNIGKVKYGTSFKSGTSALTTANYDATLIGWAAQSPDLQNNVTMQFGTTKYTGGGAAEAARNVLTGTHLWMIQDGGTV